MPLWGTIRASATNYDTGLLVAAIVGTSDALPDIAAARFLFARMLLFVQAPLTRRFAGFGRDAAFRRDNRRQQKSPQLFATPFDIALLIAVIIARNDYLTAVRYVARGSFRNRFQAAGPRKSGGGVQRSVALLFTLLTF